MPWIIFILSALLIVVAGAKLSAYGDMIAERTGVGRLWIGVVLMAAATSLPEVFTTVSAGLIDAPDLAVGDLLGAGMTNMLTLGLIDLAYRGRRVWQQTAFEHTLMATLAMGLTGLAAVFILLRGGVGNGAIGLDSFFLMVCYALGMRLVYRQEDLRRRQREHEQLAHVVADSEVPDVKQTEIRRLLLGFAGCTLAILAGAPLLAVSAKSIADLTGIGTTLIGTSLLAIATSLPELVTSLAAVRLGAFDLAVGNLFGSNAFNIAALFIADLSYRSGPLLAAASQTHVFTALWSILLMNLGLMGIIYRAEKRFVLIEPGSLLMIVGYGVGIWILAR